MLLCTILHEGAHALAVIAQGGQVTQFVWLPSPGRWGYIQYHFPEGIHFSAFAILIAPYGMWGLLGLMAGILSLRRNPYPQWIASTIFIWMFVMSLGDIANTAIPYLLGGSNDFTTAFGAPTKTAWVLTFLFGAGGVGFGMKVQQRLYRERALSVTSYTLMAGAGLFFVGALHMQIILSFMRQFFLKF
jgi:hypothetical protein